ncbi:MAG: hypothetical protein Q8P67_01645 [archaeon]|nr:hypothetical protein [archaeon]
MVVAGALFGAVTATPSPPTAAAAAAAAQTWSVLKVERGSAHETKLIQQGCLRGIYGNGAEAFALVTCEREDSEWRLQLPAGAFLCVLEAAEGVSAAQIKQFLADESASLEALPIYATSSEVVIIHPTTIDEVSPFCSFRRFPGLVKNAIYVPTEALVPQSPMPVNHPAVIRSVLSSTAPLINPVIEDYLGNFRPAAIK